MSKNFKILSFILIYIFTSEISEVVGFGYNSQTFFGRVAIRFTTLLQDLETDAVAVLSQIPLQRFSSIRRVTLDPLIAFLGNFVETFWDTINQRTWIKKEDKVNFRLYSDNRNNDSFVILEPEDDNSFTANFTTARPIKILIHGFQAAETYEFPLKTKDFYLEHTPFSVITVDWRPLAYPPLNFIFIAFNYPSALHNLNFVARRLTDLIVALHRNKVIKSPDEIHVVGYSLGAHIAGQSGFLVQKKLGSRLGRITALEPASPILQTASLEMRIDKSDASFVDVIHTSRVGMYRPVGHVDFYANGGRNQPECFDGWNALQNFSRFTNDVSIVCSHEYSYELFTWSIENRNIVGCSCSSWFNYRKYCKFECLNPSVLGEFCPTSSRGSYFLETRLPIGFNVNKFNKS